MIFALEDIINSLAGLLTARYPDYPVYASPNQQGTDHPCFFIFFMPSKIEKHMNDQHQIKLKALLRYRNRRS